MTQSFRSPAKVARRLALTRVASRDIENWPSFMFHYALGSTPDAPYRFRNGVRLDIGRGVDHVPIIEIFLRREYGTIGSNSVIVDLGANIGTFAIYAAAGAANVRVFAYEPMPEFFRLLEANVRLNRLERLVTCVNMAVAERPGDRELYVAGPGLHFPTLVTASANQAVRSRTVHCIDLSTLLDRHGLTRVDILKMDVEGAEYDILYSTPAECLRRVRELRMEYHGLDNGTRSVGSLRSFLVERGYDITCDQATTTTNGILWARRHD